MRDAVVPTAEAIAGRLSQRARRVRDRQAGAQHAPALERVADVPIYFADPLVRRSPPLQQTADARAAARRA